MPTLIIRIDCTDASDLDFIRQRGIAGVVEEWLEDDDIAERLDGDAEVSWDVED